MRSKHRINMCSIIPVDPHKRDFDCDEFIARSGSVKRDDALAAIKDAQPAAADDFTKITKTIFNPLEVDQLPMKPIFSYDVYCSVCQFSTKVKTNFVRHLLLHKNNATDVVPASTPINPVPCLEKNELMFDKMTNLAMSSHTGGRMGGAPIKVDEHLKIPEFVPVTKRYVCGANGCNYLCLEDTMLLWHWKSLHNDEDFTCTHCNEPLGVDKTPITSERISQHLKLHDKNLYKCQHCDLIFYNKTKMERDATEKHADKCIKLIVIREENEETVDEFKEKKEKRCWLCGMCKNRYATEAEIRTHAELKHHLDAQYKCSYCTYKSNERERIMEHLQTKHVTAMNDGLIVVYYKEVEVKEDDVFDTTPLWSKNKTNIKHIRGILLDDQEKITKKNPIKLNLLNSKTKTIDNKMELNLDPISDLKANADLKTTNLELKKSKLDFKKANMDVKKAELKKTVKKMNSDLIKSDLLVANSDTKTNLDLAIEAVATGHSDVYVKLDLVDVKKEDIGEEDKVNKEQPIDPLESTLYTMKIEDLERNEFVGEFGPLGKPDQGKFKCPLCPNYVTYGKMDFIKHLHKELNYDRYTCKLCNSMSTTYQAFFMHFERDHKVVLGDVSPVNHNIERWTRKVCTYQNLLIKEYRAQQEKNGLLNTILQCLYCDYKNTRHMCIVAHIQMKHRGQPVMYNSLPVAVKEEENGCDNVNKQQQQRQMARKSTTQKCDTPMDMTHCKLTDYELDTYTVNMPLENGDIYMMKMKEAIEQYDLFPSVVIVDCAKQLETS